MVGRQSPAKRVKRAEPAGGTQTGSGGLPRCRASRGIRCFSHRAMMLTITPAACGNIGLSAGPDTVLYLHGDQINNAAVITINSGGVLDLNGFTDIIGGLIFNGGTAQAGAGAIRLNGNLTANAASTTATISGELQLQGTANRTFNISAGTASPDLLISAQVTGNGGLIKTGAGELSLRGSNTYPGLTIVSNGLLRIAHASALGGNAVTRTAADCDQFRFEAVRSTEDERMVDKARNSRLDRDSG